MFQIFGALCGRHKCLVVIEFLVSRPLKHYLFHMHCLFPLHVGGMGFYL